MSIAGRAGIYLIALIISLCSLLGFSAPVYGQSAVETWSMPWGTDMDPATFNVWAYPSKDIEVTLADVEDTMPSELLVIWYYGGPVVGWKFFAPGLGDLNTLTELVPGNIYFGIVSHATSWEIPSIPTPTPTSTPTPKPTPSPTPTPTPIPTPSPTPIWSSSFVLTEHGYIAGADGQRIVLVNNSNWTAPL